MGCHCLLRSSATHQELLGVQMLQKGIQLLAALKSVKRQGWWKGKFALFRMLTTERGRGARSSPKAGIPCPPAPPEQPLGKSFNRPTDRTTCRNSKVSSTVTLKLVMLWSDQCHLDYFKYSSPLVLGSVCSHFFKASSQNCSTLCHGYGLVIM